MDPMEHKLILDYANGRCQARCSCGRWENTPLSIRVKHLRDIYRTIEEAHYRHVEEVESREPALA